MSLGEWDREPPSEDYDPGEQEPGAKAEPAKSPAAEEAPALYYANLDDFVREIIVGVFLRQVGPNFQHRWDAEWWRSAEAIMRLEALWRSWEHLRLDPATGMSVWLRDHLDHHLPMLLASDGPFTEAKGQNMAGERLPYKAPPAGLFDTPTS